jgi:hypothetical protein
MKSSKQLELLRAFIKHVEEAKITYGIDVYSNAYEGVEPPENLDEYLEIRASDETLYLHKDGSVFGVTRNGNWAIVKDAFGFIVVKGYVPDWARPLIKGRY